MPINNDYDNEDQNHHKRSEPPQIPKQVRIAAEKNFYLFHGKIDENVGDWIRSLEKGFNMGGTSDIYKVDMASSYVRYPAKHKLTKLEDDKKIPDWEGNYQIINRNE